MPQQQGISHVALTVTDVARSAEWYKRLLDAQTVVDDRDDHGPVHVIMAPPLMLGFRSHQRTDASDSFQFARVGLDHFGIACESESELEKWQARLDEIGATHSGIQKSPFGLHLNAKDPDNIAIEFFTMPQG